MRSRIGMLWSHVRRLWRPALALIAVTIGLGACVQWDPTTETIVQPGRVSAAARPAPAADSVELSAAGPTPRRTALPQ